MTFILFYWWMLCREWFILIVDFYCNTLSKLSHPEQTFVASDLLCTLVPFPSSCRVISSSLLSLFFHWPTVVRSLFPSILSWDCRFQWCFKQSQKTWLGEFMKQLWLGYVTSILYPYRSLIVCHWTLHRNSWFLTTPLTTAIFYGRCIWPLPLPKEGSLCKVLYLTTGLKIMNVLFGMATIKIGPFFTLRWSICLRHSDHNILERRKLRLLCEA